MNKETLNFLCCPNCKKDISVDKIDEETAEEILVGSLFCNTCRISYQIIKGIPVLLPSKCSNFSEIGFRDRLSKTAGYDIKRLESLYDFHHFRKIAYLRLRDALSGIPSGVKPNVLDVGIGWGLVYLPFLSRISLFGLDYSLESLLLLRSIYEQNERAVPVLICANLSAIPIKDLKFDLIWSTQVYQHVPDIEEIETSFCYLTECLLNKGGMFVIDNLNYHHFYYLSKIKGIVKGRRIHNVLKQEARRDNFYLKYYSEKDFEHLVNINGKGLQYKTTFTETLFHPELHLIPRSNLIALIDTLVQKTPFAKFLGRQISITIKRR